MTEHSEPPPGQSTPRREIELCWGTLLGADLATLVRAATGAGFDGVTATPAMVRTALAAGWPPEESGAARVTMLDPLIGPLPGTPAPGDVDPSLRPLFETGAAECFELATAVGADSVNLAHFRGDTATTWDELCDGVAATCALAAAAGLRCSFEFFPESAVPDLAAARRLVEAVDAPNLGILVDTFHLCRSGGSPAEVAALPEGMVGALQIADRPRVEPGQPYVPMSGRALPGEGVLPLPEVVSAALDRGITGLRAGIEVFDVGLQALQPTEAAGRAAHALQRLLAGIGA